MAITEGEQVKATNSGDDVKNGDYGQEHERGSDNYDSESLASSTQAGVKKVEAISKMWTTGGLVVAYCT